MHDTHSGEKVWIPPPEALVGGGKGVVVMELGWCKRLMVSGAHPGLPSWLSQLACKWLLGRPLLVQGAQGIAGTSSRWQRE